MIAKQNATAYYPINEKMKEKKKLTAWEDLSEREQVMLLHFMVTGETFPGDLSSPFSNSPSPPPSLSSSGESAGRGPENRRSKRAAATAARIWPTPPLPPSIAIGPLPPLNTTIIFYHFLTVLVSKQRSADKSL